MKFSKQQLCIGTLILVVIIIFAVLSVVKPFSYKPHGYQAVFLANGQVYFGTVQSKTRNDIELTSIYYLQSQKTSTDTTDQTQSDLKLIKLGNELHGPTDEMLINRQQVLFVENLRDDSKVVKAIKEFK